MITYVTKYKPNPYNKPALSEGMSDYFKEPADYYRIQNPDPVLSQYFKPVPDLNLTLEDRL
jgi:hypothetical protein